MPLPHDLEHIPQEQTPAETKYAIRQAMRLRRRAITGATHKKAAHQLTQKLLKHPTLFRAKHVALYLDNDGEISTRDCIRALWRRGTSVYLPILDPIRKGHLVFAHYTPDTPLALNRYGILEPTRDAPRRKPLALDCVLLPLVAFTPDGARLGMGGGYYDRTFASKKTGRIGRKTPALLGIAYECQKLERLPVEPWDVPLAAVVTEANIYQ